MSERLTAEKALERLYEAATDTPAQPNNADELRETVARRLRTDPEADDPEGLVEAARDALKYMGHLPTCDFGNDTPDGDFCTCKFAEAKRALRDRIQGEEQDDARAHAD